MAVPLFPTADKIRTVIASEAKDRHLIINAASVPGLVHDNWLLQNRSKEIMKGVEYFGNASCLNCPLAAKSFEGSASGGGTASQGLRLLSLLGGGNPCNGHPEK
jgi:hypothetical protein